VVFLVDPGIFLKTLYLFADSLKILNSVFVDASLSRFYEETSLIVKLCFKPLLVFFGETKLFDGETLKLEG